MEEQKLQEMYRMTEENNRMLHSMRRNAFIGGLIKFIVYAALVLIPIWFYMTYLNGPMQKMIQELDQMQGTSARAQTQFGSISDMLKQFESQFGGSKPQ